MKIRNLSGLGLVIGSLLMATGCAELQPNIAPMVEKEATGQQQVSSIHLNQHGFLQNGSKVAIAVTDSPQALPWTLTDQAGVIVASGRTIPFGLNTGSGQNVHQVDFSTYGKAGSELYIEVGGTKSHPFTISTDVYADLKYDVAAFFYHQRSGIAIEGKYTGAQRWARPAAHKPDTATCYGPTDVKGNDWGGCAYTLDVSRGWYDAGDHGKYTVNSGISVWTLMNYYERSLTNPAAKKAVADGTFSIPENNNGISDLLDEVRWNLEFMLAMQVPDDTKMRLPLGKQDFQKDKLKFTVLDVSGMVHHKVHDEHWTAMVMPPHLDPETRYLSYPSTAASLNLAATGAQCARLWQNIDAEFSARCLKAAKKAYAAAQRVPDAFAYIVTPGGGGGYGDRSLSDEFYWAATELYITTADEKYAADMRASSEFMSVPSGEEDGSKDISWQSVGTLGTISLATSPSDTADEERKAAQQALVGIADKYLAQTKNEGYAIAFTRPYVWGSNSDFSNRGIILALAKDFTQQEKYRTGVINLMDYVLGRNPIDQSYISGYGENPMVNPHHRFWSHSLSADLPPPPPGALSGGANFNPPADPIAREIYAECKPQTCFQDHVEAYSLNEVAINWNAPLFWVTAYLDE